MGFLPYKRFPRRSLYSKEQLQYARNLFEGQEGNDLPRVPFKEAASWARLYLDAAKRETWGMLLRDVTFAAQIELAMAHIEGVEEIVVLERHPIAQLQTWGLILCVLDMSEQFALSEKEVMYNQLMTMKEQGTTFSTQGELDHISYWWEKYKYILTLVKSCRAALDPLVNNSLLAMTLALQGKPMPGWSNEQLNAEHSILSVLEELFEAFGDDVS